MKSPIENYCICVSIGGISKEKLVPKLLLQVSVQELYNTMMIPPEEVVFKEAIDVYNNNIISDSTLRRILPPQLKNMTSQ